MPVILIDTGYLFPETYRFVDELVVKLGLNLKVYRPRDSPAWMEARHGRLWEQGLDGIERYNGLRKVEPMQRALEELGVRTWFAGLRRSQAESRSASARSNCATAAGKRTRSPTGPTAIWDYMQRTTCPTTRCGTKATSRSATCTPRAAGKPAMPRTRVSSA